jgi:hypothetical protein
MAQAATSFGSEVAGWSIRRIVGERSVQVTLLLWVLASLAVPIMSGDRLPFDRPLNAGQSAVMEVVAQQVSALIALLLMGVAYVVTRRRRVPDIASRVPSRATARAELMLLIGYGALAQIGGLLLGRALGYYPISLHLPGSIFGLRQPIAPSETIVWMAYNFAVYAVVPYCFFRRRGYSNEQLSLRSNDRVNDAVLIGTIILLEGAVELAFLGRAFFGLAPSQQLMAAPVSIVVNFIGTVVPIMIFVYAILLPRVAKLTGSVATTILIGGVAYAVLHLFDAWLLYDSVSNALLSLIFLAFQYFPPGMVKAVLTLRTANAWVHAWGYHAIVPHATLDAPNIAAIFGIR